MLNRRDFARLGSLALTGLIGCVLAVPGVAFVMTPLLRRNGGSKKFTPLARFADLKVGKPRVFPVIQERQDAWVRYPAEPVGLVWLVRQPEGSDPPVLAFSAECPHLACAINLAPDGTQFFCPCHTSNFDLKGQRLNKVAPRGMDLLEVEKLDPKAPNAMVKVAFQRFRTMTEAKVPLA